MWMNVEATHAKMEVYVGINLMAMNVIVLMDGKVSTVKMVSF